MRTYSMIALVPIVFVGLGALFTGVRNDLKLDSAAFKLGHYPCSELLTTVLLGSICNFRNPIDQHWLTLVRREGVCSGARTRYMRGDFSLLKLLVDLVWGAADIARMLGLTERQAFHVLEKRLLPAKKIGGRWVASRSALLRHFSSEE